MISQFAKRILKLQVPYQTFTLWNQIALGPPDPVLGVSEAFSKDPHPNKVNLSIGAYRDNEGRPVLLKSVEQAIKIITDLKMENEYIPTEGNNNFIKHSLVLAYGQELYNKNINKLCGIQSLSGTGCLRLAMLFIKKYMPKDTKIYFPDQTWPNHQNIARDSYLPFDKYTYYNPATKGVHFQQMCKELNSMKERQVILLHACAHNPTGCDLTKDQWIELCKIMKKKQHMPLFDNAYQGFTSGNIHTDAFGIRHFMEQGLELMTSQSYAKNMGLYGQRIGCLSIKFEKEEQAKNAISQLKIIARPIYSSPPLHGARIVELVLGVPAIYDLWLKEVKQMADRISKMRTLLYQGLKNQGSKHNWEHIYKQIGMFAFTGLQKEQCEKLIKDYHIYLLNSGRISMAGVNENNVNYIAKAFHEVTKNSKI